MYLPPAQILNKIAATVELKHRATKLLFQMNQEDLDRFLADQYQALIKAGHAPVLASAYQALEPLMLENEAISLFVMLMEDLTLRSILPEILTKQEAVLIADRDLMLTTAEQSALFDLLH